MGLLDRIYSCHWNKVSQLSVINKIFWLIDYSYCPPSLGILTYVWTVSSLIAVGLKYII